MSRSLIIGILSTVLLFVGVAIYFYYHNINTKNTPVTHAIPNDAFLILQTKNTPNFWEQLQKSELWKELSASNELANSKETITKILSFVNDNSELKDIIAENSLAVSLHQVDNRIELFAVTETSNDFNIQRLVEDISQKLNTKVQKRNFAKTLVFDLIDANGKIILCVTLKEHYLICSSQPNLIEDALRKIIYNIPNSAKGFEQAQLLAETGNNAVVLINYQKLPGFFDVLLNTTFQGMFSFTKNFANWSVLNIDLSNEPFKFSGVTYTDDSVFQFIDLFKNQTPKKLSLQEYMPQNTSMAIQMGFSDYIKFNEELNEYLQIRNRFSEYEKFKDSLENRYSISLDQQITPFIDGEASLIMIEPMNGDYINNLAALIKFKDPMSMAQSLKFIVKAMHKKGETDSINYYYEGNEIERIKLGNFLKLFYGEILEQIYSPYFVQLNDVFVFANTEATLKNIITEYKNGNTLVNNPKYKEHLKTVSHTNNISVLISPERNFLLPNSFVKENVLSTININQFTIKKFEYVSIQFANTNNKAFYTTASYLFKSSNSNSSSNETKLLWSAKLDTNFITAPQVVYNSLLKQNIIFVQDIKNTLYCISSTGNLIWKSKLNSKLVGDFVEIDAKKDGSTCYLFSTEKQANLIDENGVSLAGYPINYPGKAYIPFTLADLNNDTIIEMYVPLSNNRLMGYTITGKPISGFNPKSLTKKAKFPFQIASKNENSILYSTLDNGNLILIDKKGKTLNSDEEINGQFFQFSITSNSDSYQFLSIDTSGIISNIELDSNFTLTNDNPTGNKELFKDSLVVQYDKLTMEPYIIRYQPQSISLYNNKFSMLFNHTTADTITPNCYIIQSKSTKSFIALVKPQEQKYYLYTLDGLLYPDFPITGNSNFTISRLFMNNSSYLIGGDNRNNIFVYMLK